MRTTIRLDNTLLKAVKRYALEHNLTLSQLIEEALEEKLTRGEFSNKSFKLGAFDGGLRPGVNLDDNAALLDLMEEDTELGKLR